MPVKFKQVSTVFEQTPRGGGNIHVFALDEEGQLWERMRNVWGKVDHPRDGEPQG